MATNLEEKLREASCLGDAEAVVSLLARNADPNSQNPVNGWTALHWASKRGHENIARILLGSGAEKGIENVKGETAGDICTSPAIRELLGCGPLESTSEEEKYVPGYLRNSIGSSLNGHVDVGRVRPKRSDFSSMPTTSLPATQNDDLVLKVKVHGSSDPDFIEIEIPKWKLTYNNLLKICCEELDIFEAHVERIRKLPNTKLRKDTDIKRLKDFQEIELVLKAPLNCDKSNNCYQSISTCKDQTILY